MSICRKENDMACRFCSDRIRNILNIDEADINDVLRGKYRLDDIRLGIEDGQLCMGHGDSPLTDSVDINFCPWCGDSLMQQEYKEVNYVITHWFDADGTGEVVSDFEEVHHLNLPYIFILYSGHHPIDMGRCSHRGAVDPLTEYGDIHGVDRIVYIDGDIGE